MKLWHDLELKKRGGFHVYYVERRFLWIWVNVLMCRTANYFYSEGEAMAYIHHKADEKKNGKYEIIKEIKI